MSDKTFLTKLYPIIEKQTTNKDMETLNLHIGKYVDKNNAILFELGPTYRLYFTDSDKDVLVKNTAHLDESMVKAAVKESKYTGSNWAISTNPFNIASVLLIRKAMLAKKEQLMNGIIIYLGLHLYSSINFKYFRYEADKAIMDYTINNLTDKYLVKKLGSLYRAIEHTVLTSHDTYKDDLKAGTDEDIVNYINALKTRLDGMIKNIATEYYDNHENKRYMNLETESLEEDDYHLANSDSFELNRLTDGIYLKLLTNGPNYKLVDISANANSISAAELRNTIIKFINNKEEVPNIRKMIEMILELYIIEYKHPANTIKSKTFLYECLSIYRKSNSNDKTIESIRDILNHWLKEGSETYRKTNREATLSNFKRACYFWFVLTIQDNI